MSGNSINPGLWREQLLEAVTHSNYGIICLFKKDLAAPWIMFETGAMVGAMPDKKKIVPLIFGDLKKGDVTPLPLFLN